MAHIQTNINKFYSKLQEFWNTERYSDVTIECGNRSFKCHRLALATTCEYFDSMFGGFFKERTMEIIRMKDIAAKTFEQVLKFIYTGDLVVDSSNVVSLLQASGFFNLPGVEDLCVQFLEKNKVTSQNVFDVFDFACMGKKSTIINMCTRFFQKEFKILSNDERFYDIPFDGLNMILMEFSKILARNEDLLLNVMFQWIQRDQISRYQYSNQLFEMINFKNISSSKMQFMCQKLLLQADVNLLTNRIEPLNRNAVSKDNTTSKSPLVGLHLIMKDVKENMKKILHINDTRLCPVTCEKFQNTNTWTRCVLVDDSHLYDFSFYDHYPSKPNTAWEQRFCVYSLVDMYSKITLKLPPIKLYGKCTGAGAIQNYIYLYHPCSLYFPIKAEEFLTQPSSSSSFSNEEIRRGIYSYNCEIDEWFSMPQMRKQLNRSSMSICHNTLYIIGGDPPPKEIDSAGYAQACDPREGMWQILPRTNGIYSAAASCAIDDQVYVCGGTGDSLTHLERYDVKAGKWEELAPLNNISLSYHRMIPYKNQLWTMGCMETRYVEDTAIRIYNPSTNSWRNFEATSEENIQHGCIMDAIVLKFP